MDPFPVLIATTPVNRAIPCSEWEETCLSVFGNVLIWSATFSHGFTLNDLKRIRIVCRLWRDMSLDQWRLTATIRLQEHPDECLPCIAMPCIPCQRAYGDMQIDYGIGTLNIAEFLKLLESSEDKGSECLYQIIAKPFTRYRVEKCSLLNPTNGNYINFKRFLRIIGSKIKYLHLDHCYTYANTGYTLFGWTVAENILPNVEELNLRIIPTEGDCMALDESDSMMANEPDIGSIMLGPHAAKLEKFSLEMCKAPEDGVDQTVYRDTIGEVGRQAVQNMSKLLYLFPYLKNLQVNPMTSNIIEVLAGFPHKLTTFIAQPHMSLTRDDFRLLATYMKDAKPQLEVLKVGDSIGTEMRRFLHGCLGYFQTTLQELEMHRNPTSFKYTLSSNFQSHIFSKLTRLHLHGEPFVSFRALSGLPRLENLRLYIINGRRFDQNRRILRDKDNDTDGNMAWPKMKQLHIENCKLNLISLKILKGWMPNMQIIKMSLSEITSKEVQMVWPNVTLNRLVPSDINYVTQVLDCAICNMKMS